MLTREEKNEQLIKNLQMKVTELMAGKSSLEEENLSLKEKITDLNRQLKETTTIINVELLDVDIKKKVLQAYARNKSTLTIHKEIGKIYGLSLDEIDEITKNLENLDSELIEFFKKEVEYFRENDIIKFLSEQDRLKDSIDFTLTSLDSQISSYEGIGILTNEQHKIYSDLLAKKKDFLSIRLKLVDTYKSGTSLTNTNKENSSTISVEIKKEINNVMNINTFKNSGLKVSEIEMAEEVSQWK